MQFRFIMLFLITCIASACNPEETFKKNHNQSIIKISSYFKHLNPIPGTSFSIPCASSDIIGLVSNPVLNKIKYRDSVRAPHGIIIIKIKTNVSIKASEGGIVGFTGRLNMNSVDFSVEIIHKGVFKTLYSGLKSHNLTEGVFIAKESVIGKADNSLGFAVYIRKSIIDPDYISIDSNPDSNPDSNNWIDIYPVGLLFGEGALK